jgi:hypothetical protein
MYILNQHNIGMINETSLSIIIKLKDDNVL